jgi:hypothetical protein
LKLARKTENEEGEAESGINRQNEPRSAGGVANEEVGEWGSSVESVNKISSLSHHLKEMQPHKNT